MSRNFEIRFTMLPLAAKVPDEKKFWSGDYWALNKGNINHRWNASRGFNMSSPTREKLKTMSPDEIAQLSPSEKFDILNGDYHYPLKKEVQALANPQAENWEGICHGWAPASMNHHEPTPKILVNPDGVAIAFGSADIKAILSYFYAYAYQVLNTHQVGRRCYRNPLTPNEDCKKDLNAGAWHIILANKIGLDQEGFIADVNRFEEVWNHPIKSYKTRVLKQSRTGRPNSAPGTSRLVFVETTITYASETGNYWEPVIGTKRQVNRSMVLSYIIELDSYGIIIGGEWLSVKRPDFLWVKEKAKLYYGQYSRLKELLND